MLKEFWERYRHLVETATVLLVASALFLSIPLPDNEKARAALQNIQFVWFLLTTVGALVVFVLFWGFVFEAGETLEKRYVPGGILAVVLFALAFSLATTLIVNLWRYMFAVYRVPLQSLLGNLAGAWTITQLLMIAFIALWLRGRIPEWAFHIALAFIAMAGAGNAVALTSLAHAPLTPYPWLSWLLVSAIYFAVARWQVFQKSKRK